MAIKFEKDGRQQRTPSGKKRSRSLSFYAAILLCAGAAAFTVAANRTDRGADKGELLADNSSSMPFEESLPADEAISGHIHSGGLMISDTDLRAPVTTTTTTASPTTTSPSRLSVTEPSSLKEEAVTVAAPLRFGMPGEGTVTNGFSGDELVFCSTMGDWRIHNGIDISGNSGDKVLACADGVVEGFAADMLYGNTAVVRHSDDSVIYYSGLSDTQMVSAGLHIKAGDVIGYIGEVPCELEDGPHIHLTMVKDGKFIDPAPLLSGQ